MKFGFWNGIDEQLDLEMIAGGQSYPLNDLIAYWKLDEVSTGVAPVQRNDSIGTLHLTDTNTCPSVAGKISNGVSTTIANSERLESANTTVLAAGTGVSFEVAFWVQLKVLANTSILGKNLSWDVEWNNGSQRLRAIFKKGDNSGSVVIVANSLGVPSQDTWYFINAWHDADNDQIGIRVNDTYQDVDNTYTFDVYSVSSPFVIGWHVFTGYFTGYVDEVGFWQRILTPSERTYLYNNGNGRPLPL